MAITKTNTTKFKVTCELVVVEIYRPKLSEISQLRRVGRAVFLDVTPGFLFCFLLATLLVLGSISRRIGVPSAKNSLMWATSATRGRAAEKNGGHTAWNDSWSCSCKHCREAESEFRRARGTRLLWQENVVAVTFDAILSNEMLNKLTPQNPSSRSHFRLIWHNSPLYETSLDSFDSFIVPRLFRTLYRNLRKE